MLGDEPVAVAPAQARVNLAAWRTKPKQVVCSCRSEHRRAGRALGVIGGEPYPNEADGESRGAGALDRLGRLLDNLALAHLCPEGGACIGSTLAYEIVLHVEHK